MAEKREWTEEDDDALRRARRQGLSWGRVAKRLKRGRTPVVERAKFLGEWAPREMAAPAPKAPAPAPPPPSELGLLPPPVPPHLMHRPRAVPPPCCCQWPVGGQRRELLVCGAPLAGRSYCAEHQAVAYIRIGEGQGAEQRA